MFQNKNSASVRANSLFEGIDKNFKININQKDFVEKREGEIIYQNGDSADYIYLLLEGEIKQKISGVFTTPVIVKSTQNDFFGEKEVLENLKRSSSAVANTDCLLYRFEKSTISALSAQNNIIKRNLYKSLLMDEPEETTQTEPQKKFFINADDSTKKFKIPEEKTDKQRVEILHEDLADRELPAAEVKEEPPAEVIEEPAVKNDPDMIEEVKVSADMTGINFPAEDEKIAPDEIETIPEDATITDDDAYTDKEPFTIEDLAEIESRIEIDEEFNLTENEISEINNDLADTTNLDLPKIQPGLSDDFLQEDKTISTNEEPDVLSEPAENAEPPAAGEILVNWHEEQFPVDIQNSIEDFPDDNTAAEQEKEVTQAPVKKTNTGKEVAGLFSNDILYPVNTLKFYADQIKKREISAELNEVVNLLIEQANIINDMADVIFDYTEDRSSLNINPVSINSVLDEVLGLLADFIESRSSRLYKKFETTVTVDLDKRKFYQAMFQFAKITCNTIPAGGNIYVVLTSDENYARIIINTTPAQARTDKSSSGGFNPLLNSGIGYLIAERIIKDHGGKITFEAADEGTKLVISIPVSR